MSKAMQKAIKIRQEINRPIAPGRREHLVDKMVDVLQPFEPPAAKAPRKPGRSADTYRCFLRNSYKRHWDRKIEKYPRLRQPELVRIVSERGEVSYREVKKRGPAVEGLSRDAVDTPTLPDHLPTEADAEKVVM